MSFSVRMTTGSRHSIVMMKGIGKITERGIRKAWHASGKDLKSEASRQILKKPKHGRTYIIRTRSGRRRRHVASAPGESHANLTGALRRSIGWKIRGASQMEFGYGIINDAPKYGKYLEFGTKFMAARPSLLNAINGTRRNIEQHFAEQVFREFT